MNKAVKRRWIAALRSGQYKQAEGQLREVEYHDDDTVTVNGYCCLGVLCDLYAKSKVGKGTKWKGNEFLGEDTYLPKKVRAWAEIASQDVPGEFRAAKGYDAECAQGALVTLNDTIGAGFKRIANWIEKNL